MNVPIADIGVPLAYESTDAGFMPVEAPPCGDRLIVPDHGIDLSCDQPRGHQERMPWTKHRAIIDHAKSHAVSWCNGDCSRPCTPVSCGVIPFLQRVERTRT